MLKNKTILITGASSGIGEECAKQFAKANARLILCARRYKLVENLAEDLRAIYGCEVYTVQLDVTDYKAVSSFIASLPEHWKGIDILINNAGLAAGLDLLQEGKIDDWEMMIDTNIKGLLYITRSILPLMIKRNFGYIFNIGSVAGHTVYPKGAVYCATKYAVKALTQGLRMDLIGTDIRVTTIDPGMVQTNFSTVRFEGNKEKAEEIYQGMRPLTAEDIADAIIYCATRPPHVNIAEMIIMPTDQAAATMVSRKDSE